MGTTLVERAFPKKKRQEVFEALVELQDGGMSLDQSRQAICKRYSLTGDELKGIEREGITEEWPPLG